MLLSLHIENIAVIEKSDVDFCDGLNILTGETGAGKSIIIDSINLLLGNRSTRDIIRTGADYSLVSAVFCNFNSAQKNVLKSFKIFPDGDGNIIITRKISQDGRGFTKVNGEAVTLSLLKNISGILVNIHGQHDGSKILDPSSHIDYLDEYCSINPLILDYQQKYKVAREMRKVIDELTRINKNKQELQYSLKYKIDEIEKAQIKPGELETMKRARNIADNNMTLSTALANATRLLSSDEGGILDSVGTLLAELTSIQNLIPGIQDTISSIEKIKAEIENISESVSKHLDDFEDIDYSSEYIEERIYTIEKILKKYSSEQAALDSLENFKSELMAIDENDLELEKQTQMYAEAIKLLENSASKLSQARKNGATQLSKEICNELKELDMPDVKFETRITRNTNSRGGNKYTASGFDCVEFLISPNIGQELRPISKIASGGELSRIMLCLKTILGGKDSECSTIIFDEIDSGVSGSTAQKIGYKIKNFSVKRQVFCITHLAQIAALADHHYKVEKESTAVFTRSNIRKLGDKARRYEIARIMGGIDITDQMLRSADELINNSKKS